MNNKTRSGTLAVILSSVLFGITPIFARITYQGGNNSINMVFLRALIALLCLFAVMLIKRIPLKPQRNEIGLLIAGGLSAVFTTLLLYSSYSFVDVGVATTLHFSYPLIVVVISTLFFKERLTFMKLFSLALGLAGIFMLSDFSAGSSFSGILLASLSAFTFSGKVLLLGKSRLKNIPAVKTTFYICLVETLSSLMVGISTQQITLAFEPQVWLLIILVAVLASVVAVPCFSYGISCIGSPTASILSTFEPITSIALGILLLNEALTFRKIIGCIMILIAVMAILVKNRKVNDPLKP